MTSYVTSTQRNTAANKDGNLLVHTMLGNCYK